jgi:hypothetical protein
MAKIAQLMRYDAHKHKKYGGYIGGRSIPCLMGMGARHKRLSLQMRGELLGNHR